MWTIRRTEKQKNARSSIKAAMRLVKEIANDTDHAEAFTDDFRFCVYHFTTPCALLMHFLTQFFPKIFIFNAFF